MKITDTRKGFFALYQQLSILGELKGARFSFIISHNKKILAEQLDAIREMSKMSEDFKEYEAERVVINKKYALKDEKAKEIVKDENYQIPEETRKEFDAEIDALKEKYKDVIDERENQKVEVEEYASEEVILDLKPLPLKFVPESVTVEQMDILLKLVQE